MPLLPALLLLLLFLLGVMLVHSDGINQSIKSRKTEARCSWRHADGHIAMHKGIITGKGC